MASNPDDNPFARESMWPKMPQTPMRVGGHGRVGETRETQPPAADPDPAPQRLTPVFVRPLDTGPGDLGGVTPVAVTPMREPTSTPAPPSRITPLVVRPTGPTAQGPQGGRAGTPPVVGPLGRAVDGSAAIPREAAGAVDVRRGAPTEIQLEPASPPEAAPAPTAVVTHRDRPKVKVGPQRRMARLMIPTGAVALLAAAGAFLFWNREAPAEDPQVAGTPVETAAPDPSAARAVVSPTAPSSEPASRPPPVRAPLPTLRQDPAIAPPSVGAVAALAPVPAPRPRPTPSVSGAAAAPSPGSTARPAVAEATEDAMTARVLTLPPPPPAVAEPLPTYTPPPAPDPNAPMTSIRRY